MSTLSKGKVAALLLKLSLADASIRLDNGLLKVKGWEALPVELQEEITTHKAAIIKYLTQRETMLAEAQTDDEDEGTTAAPDTAPAPDKPKLDRRGHLVPLNDEEALQTTKYLGINKPRPMDAWRFFRLY